MVVGYNARFRQAFLDGREAAPVEELYITARDVSPLQLGDGRA